MVSPASEARLRSVKYLLQAAGVAAAYFIAGKIGLAVPFTHTNVSALWPPAGLALAAVLLFGYQMWPAIFLGAFLVNFVTPIPAIAALGIAAGNTLAALAGAYLLRRNPRFNPALVRISDAIRFILLGGVVGSLISASNGVLVLSAAQLHPWASLGVAWLVWWLGDTMGVLIVAPLVLGVAGRRDLLGGRSLAEASALLLTTAVAAIVVFDDRVMFVFNEELFAFFLVPFVIWGATRFGTAGSAAVMAVIASIAVWESAQDSGPFVHAAGVFHGAALLQLFLGVVSVTGLILAAVICERDTAEETLKRRQELQRQTELLHAITQNATAGLLMIDLNSRCTFMNPAAERITGFSFAEMNGRIPHEVLHHTRPDGSPYPPAECPLNRALPRMQPMHDIEEFFIHKQGHFYPVRCSARPIVEDGKAIGTVWEVQDVTRQKKTEKALLESEKLALMGRTSAVIAHEINNPLAAITNLVYLLQQHPTLDEGAQAHVLALRKEVARVAHITKQTLGFYRTAQTPMPVRLSQVADEAIEACAKIVKEKGVNIARNYQSLGDIQGYPIELRQVFVNLLDNAIEAVRPGGNIVVDVSEVESARDHRPSVKVVVSDDGPGIPTELKSEIFEPFFSTKGEKGTGLGLWVTRSIVYKHEGSIEVLGNGGPGPRGTAFSIVLPKTLG
jgi:PAS domain S-box-containing protein